MGEGPKDGRVSGVRLEAPSPQPRSCSERRDDDGGRHDQEGDQRAEDDDQAAPTGAEGRLLLKLGMTPAPGSVMCNPGRTAAFFRSLGHPTRVAVIELLSSGEKDVTDLVAATGVPQGRLSSHLTILRAGGVVTVQRRGHHRFYRVADPRAQQAVTLARQLIRTRAAYIPMCQCIQKQ